MTEVADTAFLLPQLLAENARLKTKVGIPENERVLQEVLREQLQRFFDDAKRTLENAVSRAFATGNEGEERGNGDGSQRISTLLETLRALGEQNEELLRQMSDIQTQRVVDLHGKVEQLEYERDTLRHCVLKLEEDVAAATATPSDGEAPPSLLEELRSFRASDALLRQRLDEIQHRSEMVTAEADKVVKDGIHVSLKLPQLLEQLEEMRGSLHHVETERELFRLQVQESKHRGDIRHALREAQLEEEVALERLTVQKLLARVKALEACNAETQATATAHLETIAQLENTIQSLHAKHALANETLASKRRRLEEEILDDPNSVRREYITFWREGREELRQLREEMQQLRGKERLLRTTQVKLAQMERTRSTVTSKLVTLADEISRVRKENQSLRAQCAGLEVERDYLRSNLAAAISQHMQEGELLRCCAAIRDAASKSAAASSSVVADPQAIQQAMRQSQELKNELAQLNKQKEKLHRYIALCEERIVALITRETLHSPATGGDGDHSVVQLVELAELHAEDVSSGLEEDASSGTSGSVRRRGALLGMQQRIKELEQQLGSYQKQLNSVIAERDCAQKQLAETQTEMRGTLAARETAISEVLNSNTTLMQFVETLRSEKEQLRECYKVSVIFTQKLSTALSGLLGLLRSEMDLVGLLNGALTAERTEVVELTRRSAEVWDARESEVQEVMGAIDRMCGYILQAVEQQQRVHTIDDTVHLRRLTEEVKLQENRLREMQQTFSQACRELGEGLAKRIREAQQRGDAMWKRRVETLVDERQQLQTQLGAEKDLLAKLERSLLVPFSSLPAITAESSTAPATVTVTAGPLNSSHQVLDAVNQLLAAVSSQRGAVEAGDGEKVWESPTETSDDPLLLVAPTADDAGEIQAALESEEKKGHTIALKQHIAGLPFDVLIRRIQSSSQKNHSRSLEAHFIGVGAGPVEAEGIGVSHVNTVKASSLRLRELLSQRLLLDVQQPRARLLLNVDDLSLILANAVRHKFTFELTNVTLRLFIEALSGTGSHTGCASQEVEALTRVMEVCCDELLGCDTMTWDGLASLVALVEERWTLFVKSNSMCCLLIQFFSVVIAARLPTVSALSGILKVDPDLLKDRCLQLIYAATNCLAEALAAGVPLTWSPAELQGMCTSVKQLSHFEAVRSLHQKSSSGRMRLWKRSTNTIANLTTVESEPVHKLLARLVKTQVLSQHRLAEDVQAMTLPQVAGVFSSVSFVCSTETAVRFVVPVHNVLKRVVIADISSMQDVIRIGEASLRVEGALLVFVEVVRSIERHVFLLMSAAAWSLLSDVCALLENAPLSVRAVVVKSLYALQRSLKIPRHLPSPASSEFSSFCFAISMFGTLLAHYDVQASERMEELIYGVVEVAPMLQQNNTLGPSTLVRCFFFLTNSKSHAKSERQSRALFLMMMEARRLLNEKVEGNPYQLTNAERSMLRNAFKRMHTMTTPINAEVPPVLPPPPVVEIGSQSNPFNSPTTLLTVTTKEQEKQPSLAPLSTPVVVEKGTQI